MVYRELRKVFSQNNHEGVDHGHSILYPISLVRNTFVQLLETTCLGSIIHYYQKVSGGTKDKSYCIIDD